MTVRSRHPKKKSDPSHRSTRTVSPPADIERLVEERTAEIRHELEVLRRQRGELKEAKTAFKEQENQFKIALESAGAGIWIRDPEQGWSATRELNALFGRSPDDPLLSEEEFLSCIHPDDLPGLRKAWSTAIDHGSDFSQEYRVIWQDGSVHWLASQGRVSPGQSIPVFSGITYDITERKRVEDSLIDSEEELRNLIESSSDGIVITDHQGRITTWNRGAEIITGLAARDVIGLPAWDIQAQSVSLEGDGQDPRTMYRTDWERLLRDDSDPHFAGLFDGKIRRPGGDIRYIEQNVFRIPGQQGFRIGCILRDITERKRIEEAVCENEEKYRTLVEMFPDVIIIHQDGKIVYANPALAKLLTTTTPESIIGMDVFQILHPDFHTTVRENIENDLDGMETPATEVQIVRGDGSVVTFEGRGRRILYKGKPAIQVAIRDVTERKAADLKLREYSDNLKRSNEDLELFAYIATHDLQEPIRHIVTYAQLLISEAKDPQAEKYLKIIENAGLRMNSLVSDLREYSRVRSQTRPLEAVDMENVLEHALDHLQPAIRESRASITHDQLPVVLADRTQVTQVVQNLIGNAIKFQERGTVPAIHVSVSFRDGMWQFGIADNGIGIPAEYHQKIFVLFERLHARDSYPGSGLGLALSKRIIERHGGRMWVESEVGVGSTFFFTLPAVPSS